MNFEEKKTTYKEVTENSDASLKNLKSESKKIYDAVETSSKNLKVSRKSSTLSTSDSYSPLIRLAKYGPLQLVICIVLYTLLYVLCNEKISSLQESLQLSISIFPFTCNISHSHNRSQTTPCQRPFQWDSRGKNWHQEFLYSRYRLQCTFKRPFKHST